MTWKSKTAWKPWPTSRSGWILTVVVLIGLFLFADYHRERWRKGLLPRNNPQTSAGEGLVIRCDGLGYYAWLRSLLIDGDWSFDNEFDEHNVLGDFVPPPDWRTPTGRRALPWSIGPACWWALTVVPGHWILKGLEGWEGAWPTDGYCLPYQLLVGCGTLLASVLGLFFLYGICRLFARPERAALTAALLTLGTTIAFYGAIEVSMAHGVGTMAVAALTWYWLRSYRSVQPGRWLLLGVLVGLVMLTRWQLATFAVLPLGEAALQLRRRRSAGRAAACLALAAVGVVVGFFPQMLAWRCVYGQWLATPIATEPHCLTPSLGALLWSSDRGLFYWTPLALLACLGYVALLRRNGELNLHDHGRPSAPFRGLAAPAVLDQAFTPGVSADENDLEPRSRGFSRFGFSLFPARSWLKPNCEKPRERGCKSGLMFREPGVNAGPITASAGSPLKGAECLPQNMMAREEAAVLLLIAFLLQVYVLGSLWGGQVYLGVSFGFRHLTETVVALAPGLALLLEWARRPLYRALCGVGVALIAWNLLLIAQYRYGLLPAAGGADLGTMAANCVRLIVRKKALLVGQVLAGPALLALLIWRGEIRIPGAMRNVADGADKPSGRAARQTSRLPDRVTSH